MRGTGFSRLTLLLRSVALFASADASLYGVVDGGFVLLATSQHEGTHNSLGEEPDLRQGTVLQKVLASQRPALQELPGSETGSTSTGGDLGAVCAVPLFGGPSVVGALLLDASPTRSSKPVIPCEGSTPEHSHLAASPIEQPGATAAAAAAAKKRTRQRLFSSPALLHQLGLAVSVALGLDGEQLQWLARALHHVASCDTFHSLVWQLCEDVAAHVRRRFIVEAGVRAVLLPRAEAPLGLLFHRTAGPSSSSPGGGESAVRGSGAAAEPPGQGGPPGASSPRSAQLSAEGATLQPQPLSSQLQPAGFPAGAAQQPSSKLGALSSLTSRNRLSALATYSGAGTSDCGATSRLSRRPASTHFSGSSGTAPGRALTLFSDALGGSRGIDPHHLNLPMSAAFQSPLAGRATLVVQLPPHMAAEAPAASLHAQAFPLKHTVLQALAGAAFGGGSISGSISGGGFPGTCIEDVALYLQNVHNPSRDVCLLLGGTRGAPLGQPGSPRTLLAAAPTGPLSLQYGSSGGGGGGGGGGLQSLVLVGLSLGDSVLALYLCFRKRLPGELLLAVRDSCNELLGEVFAGPVRAKLEGSLAAEFETLCATTPGHFAVLRSASVNGLLLQQPRQGIQGTASLRAATRLIAPPRGSCGALLHTTRAMSGSSEAAVAATAPGAAPVAVAVGAAVAAEGGTGAGPYTCRLTRRTSMDLSCCSQAEVALLTAACATARGAGLPRPVSFSTERGAASAGANVLRATNAVVRSAVAVGARHVSREAVPVALANDELMSALLALRQSETAGGGCSSQQGEPASASIMTVTGVDAAAGLRQQLDLLVTSIQTTMTTEGNGAMLGFADDLESLELLDVLGHGGGGIVYRGRLGTQEVAVKVMELPDLDGGDVAPVQQLRALGGGGGDDDGAPASAPNPAAAAAVAKEQLRARRALLRNAMEMAVQGRVSHPNLIQVYATYTNVLVERRSRADGSSFHCLVPADGGEGEGVHDLGLTAPPTSSCAIVAELADCGSLAGALTSRVFPRVVLVPRVSSGWEQQPFQLDMRGVYMTLLDVALALRHLHSLNLVHRDVKPANLLLKSNPRDPRGFTVKLADFGFVLQLSEVAEDGSRYVMVDQACGTVTHMAPELLPGKARVDASADVYSFGILMWELVSGGVRPFPHLHPDHIPRHVYKGARPVFGDVVPLTYRGLAQACWSAEPHRRPRASDLVTMITAHIHEME